MAKIVHLPKTRMNPMALLGEVMEHKPDAVITISRVDGEWSIGWSSMTIQELVYAATWLRVKVDNMLNVNGAPDE
jgi:hypothetical protein